MKKGKKIGFNSRFKYWEIYVLPGKNVLKNIESVDWKKSLVLNLLRK